jgi:hypothetical protein
MGTTRTSSEFRASSYFVRGRSSEQRVAQLLQKRGWFVIPSYDYASEDGNKAPKLQGQLGSHMIPDLDVSKLQPKMGRGEDQSARRLYTYHPTL